MGPEVLDNCGPQALAQQILRQRVWKQPPMLSRQQAIDPAGPTTPGFVA